MAVRFMDGFDHYPIADFTQKWSGGTNVSMSTSTTRFGSGQSLLVNGFGSFLKIIDSQTTWIVGVAARFPGFASGGAVIQFKSGSNVVGYLNLSSSGILSIVSQNASGTTTLATGTTTLTVNVWYYIEFKYTCAATAGLVAAACRIGGVAECSVAATSGGSTTNGTSIDTIAFVSPANGNYFFDDFYACDASGSVHTTLLGDVRVETLYPSGAGYSTTFSHSGASTNWQAVSEATEDGDTSYVSTSSAGNIDSYAMTDLGTTPTAIYGVQATLVARKDDAGSRTIDQVTRIGGTNYLGSDVGLADSYNFIRRVMEVSPATSVAWTATEVNGVEMGIKLVS